MLPLLLVQVTDESRHIIMYVNSLHFGWCQCLLLLIPPISHLSAAFIMPGNAIEPSAIIKHDLNSSPTLKAPISVDSPQCVSPASEPDWVGPIHFADCQAALWALEYSVSRYGSSMWTFWSHHKVGPSGPATKYWLLPEVRTSGKSFCSSFSVGTLMGR